MKNSADYNLVAVFLTIVLGVLGSVSATPHRAIAVVRGPIVKGNVTFTQNDCGQPVYIIVQIEGLTPGKHGFHVHDKGDLSNECASMLGHFNPDKMDHGGPDHEIRHVGDLGNIEADVNGRVDITITDKIIQLTGSKSIIGRGLVVHESVDDLGQGGHIDSKKTGNAGGRVACGVIGVLEPDTWTTCGNGAANVNSFTFIPFLITLLVSIIIR